MNSYLTSALSDCQLYLPRNLTAHVLISTSNVVGNDARVSVITIPTASSLTVLAQGLNLRYRSLNETAGGQT